MGNGGCGWYGTEEEWDRIEAPLLELDAIIQEFAKQYNLTISKNDKGWPSRAMEWGDMHCLIQLYLEDDEALTFNLWLCVYQDRSDKRYWRKEFLIREKPIKDFKKDLPTLLVEGRSKLISWSKNPELFEFATNLAHI